jgi:hypothetical protein
MKRDAILVLASLTLYIKLAVDAVGHISIIVSNMPIT